MIACNLSRGPFCGLILNGTRSDKTGRARRCLFSREMRPFDNPSSQRRLSFPRRVAYTPGIYFNADTSRNNSLDAHRARKPAERDINPRSRYLRCFGQRVPCYPRPSTFIPRACRCRCIITGFRSGKCFAFPRRFPRKETRDSVPPVSRPILFSKRALAESSYPSLPLIENKRVVTCESKDLKRSFTLGKGSCKIGF